LLDAAPDSARVILLGDAHQLASVEAGAALGDICAEASRSLADSIVFLEKSYRFDERSGIGGVAQCIKAGDVDGALAILRRPGSEASLIEVDGDALERALETAVTTGYLEFCRAPTAADALTALERFRLLAAHRRGPRGVETLNALTERALHAKRLIDPESGSGRFYRRRPLMVTENDYGVGLYNGDVGVVFPASDGSLRVHFGAGRALSPSRVPPHETVFATSIHKSQGSEFDVVAIVLPEPRSALLTRELLYTAVTRARQRVVLYGSAESIRLGIGRRVERASGLGDRLRELSRCPSR
jgi:exodeoxyribonuclease V alpha subunit